MAVVDNAGVDAAATTVGSSLQAPSPKESHHAVDQPKPPHLDIQAVDPNPPQSSAAKYPSSLPRNQAFQGEVPQLQNQGPDSPPPAQVGRQLSETLRHGGEQQGKNAAGGGGLDSLRSGDAGKGFQQDMTDLEELLSKLNPMAAEFIPPSLANNGSALSNEVAGAAIGVNGFGVQNRGGRRKRNSYATGKRRMNSRTIMAQRDEIIRRTVYVSEIDHQVTEEQLAALFLSCGQVVDCRVCGDPNSVLRFAFIEFTDEEGARAALGLSGTMLGYYPVRVLPSKTAIAPVNPTFLPRSADEREMCARTIYCTNIDKKVSQAEVKLFFESICGEVHRLRLLGDYHHSTRIAFVEFVIAESAIAALNCSGVVLGSLPIRVSPSKTPVRPRSPRRPPH